MDLVYPLGSGSKHDDMELFYSIQSALKYVPHDNIWIFGDEPKCIDALPPWVRCVPNQTNGRNKEDNIRQNLEAACRDPRVTDDFIMVNDDHFFCGAAPAKIPNCYSGNIMDHIREQVKGWYNKSLTNTEKFLASNYYDRLYYDVHCPMVLNKKSFLGTMRAANWTEPGGYVVKSLYANLRKLRGVPVAFTDLKFTTPHTAEQIRAAIKDRWVFSLDDAALNEDMWEVLKNL